MTPEFFHKIAREGAMTDLSSRAKWILTGGDRVRYLNGQTTNDVRRASEHDALYACITNAKGRIEGDVFIHAPSGDMLCVDAEPGLREPLSARLEKYLVADDVVITDVTDEWRMLHVFGGVAEQGAWSRELGARGMGPDEKIRKVEANRFGVAGCDLWIPASIAVPPAPCSMLSADEAELWRICQGMPRWPQELNSEAFPQEARLEERAMDFSKGCYVGQEVLSRIKTTGKMPRRLVKFRVRDAAFSAKAGIPGAGTRLWWSSAEGLREAGTVTSACLHPVLDRVVGLAYVRQDLERETLLSLAPEHPPGILFEVEISPQ
jgi:folate-binding protein YgfZ